VQAVILSGGQGTRLRPLTSTMPKPAVPMVNKPMLWYMVDWLHGHGVTDIVMSVGFLADGLRAALDETGHEGVTIRYIEEPEPFGTAGAIKYVADNVELDERILVLNGDVLTDYDITAQIAQHESTGARATLALVPVDDPTAYGLVLTDDEHRIESFLEKPDAADVPPNPRINAGGYVLQTEVLQMLPSGEKRSFEHDVFPHLVGDGIYAYDADGYWLDLGTPERYVEATRDLLDNNLKSWLSTDLATTGNSISSTASIEGAKFVGPVVVDDDVSVDRNSVVGPYSVLAEGVNIGAKTRVVESVLMKGCVVGDGAQVYGSLIGPGVTIGAGATIESGCVIGEGASIEAGARIAGDSRIDADSGVAA
jgi:mannose-1-phosphate guanylyltransferase